MDQGRWIRIGGVGALLFVILQTIGQSMLQAGGMEPSFAAPAEEILSFFAGKDPGLFAAGSYLSVISFVPFLFFVCSLWVVLRRAEGGEGILSTFTLVTGAVSAAANVGGGDWELAVMRVSGGLDPHTATLIFDLGNRGFANVWVLLGAMMLAANLVVLQSDRAPFPRWTGWFGLLTGAGMIAARVVWASSGIVFVPYMLFYIWLLAVGISLLRRKYVQTAAATV